MQTSSNTETTFVLRGMSYDAGTEYVAGTNTRMVWNLDDVARDMAIIAAELHCNSVNIYGTDLERIVAAARIAHEAGLHVSLQLRAIDRDRRSTLDAIAAAASAADALSGSGQVTLNIGCEASLFTAGFLPGRSFLTRMKLLAVLWPLLPIINWRLNAMLAEGVIVARQSFDGPVIYSAGVWEEVDWAPFDLVGVNLYRDRENEATYLRDLRRLLEHEKPLVITEFGCCTFEGAERLGGGGWLAVDHSASPPRVKPGYVRSEETQARLISELLGIYAAEGVHGAYVFDFLEAANPHASEPVLDLDMASYGIVKPEPSHADDKSIEWTPKQAFNAVADAFERLRKTRKV